jgi:hypothetical protein
VLKESILTLRSKLCRKLWSYSSPALAPSHPGQPKHGNKSSNAGSVSSRDDEPKPKNSQIVKPPFLKVIK